MSEQDQLVVGRKPLKPGNQALKVAVYGVITALGAVLIGGIFGLLGGVGRGPLMPLMGLVVLASLVTTVVALFVGILQKLNAR